MPAQCAVLIRTRPRLDDAELADRNPVSAGAACQGSSDYGVKVNIDKIVGVGADISFCVNRFLPSVLLNILVHKKLVS